MNREKRKNPSPEETIEKKQGVQPEETAGAAESKGAEADAETPAEEESPENGEPSGDDTEEKSPGKKRRKKHGRRKGAVKEYFHSTRFKHGSVSTAITAAFLVVIILINVVVSLLGERFPSMNFDMTTGGINTLSEEALGIVDSVASPTTIYILTDEATAKTDSLLSAYGIKYSQISILAGKIAERNSNIKVEYVDMDQNPSFKNQYSSLDLQEGNVLVASEKRNRLLGDSDLFEVSYSSDYTSVDSYSKVENALASALNSTNADTVPVVALDTAHNEMIDTSTLKRLLQTNNFDVVDFSLLTEAIPENAQMVVLGVPSTDLTQEEVKKLEDYLGNTSNMNDRSLMVSYHASQGDLPNLAEFMAEWGMGVQTAVVYESDPNNYVYSNDASSFLAETDSSITLNDSTSTYQNLIMPQSSPIDILFDSKGSITVDSLVKSKSTSYLVTEAGAQEQKASYTLAALSQNTLTAGEESCKANVIAWGSAPALITGILDQNAYGDGKYIVDLTRYATGADSDAGTVSIESALTNTSDIVMSTAQTNVLGLGIFTVLIPLLTILAGILVYFRRRHL